MTATQVEQKPAHSPLQRKPYAPPAVLQTLKLETRAGSPFGLPTLDDLLSED